VDALTKTENSKIMKPEKLKIVILTAAILLLYFPCARTQISFVPPSIPMWDTWIYEEDENYHLFYLSRGNIGRAVSTDMLRWKALPTIENTAKEGDWDEVGMIMTGSTFKLGDTYFMCYGSRLKGTGPGIKIGYLTSKDLVNWERYSDGPIVLPQPPYEVDTKHWRDLVPFYDPVEKIWDGYLFAVHAETERPSIAHLTTKDFSIWDYHEPIFIGEDYSRTNDGFVYLEVPDHFEMGGKFYIVFSSVRSRKEFTSGRKDASGTWYLMADNKEGPYKVPESPLLLGYGHGRADTYVGHTVTYKGQRLLYHHTWGSWDEVCLGTPKLVHQNADGTLELRFWKDLRQLEERLLHREDEIVCNVSEEESRKLEIIEQTKSKDIVISCRVNLENTSRAGIIWHSSSEKSQGITFYPLEHRITIGEVEHTSRLKAKTIWDHYVDDYTKEHLLDGEFDLRIMSRAHMAEVYINDKWIFTTSMLETPQEGEIGYWSDQGALVISDLHIFEMEGL
jgi:beta-fructofuranosidase